MLKRQDRVAFLKQKTRYIILLILLLTAGCQTGPDSPYITPTTTMTTIPSKTAELPTETPTHEITPPITKEATASTTVPYATATPSACLETRGKVQKASFYSLALEEDFEYQVYLPPCYMQYTEKSYPTAYLLHGLGYTNQQWLDLGLVDIMNHLINTDQISPYIIILPQEAPIEAPQISRYDQALVEDLVPWIDQLYRTKPAAESRAIGGISRGAGWAVRIGFEHWDIFSRVGAHSLPLFDADGKNLYTWLINIPKETTPTFFIDIGRSDPEWQTAEDFANLLDTYAIPHEWYLFNGEHSKSYWAAHLPEYLKWYARNWSEKTNNNAVK